MTGWKKVCCGIDFAEQSRVAMLAAAEEARQSGAPLVLVHVYEPPHASMIANDMLAPEPGEVTEKFADELLRKLEPWREEAEHLAGGAKVTAHVLAGDPAERLTRFAREDGADLVVVGTHGRKGVARAVVGSVAEHVVRNAEGAVLVVRRPEPTA